MEPHFSHQMWGSRGTGLSYSDYSLYGGPQTQTGYEKVSVYNGKSLRYTGNNKTNTKVQIKMEKCT